MNFSGSIRAKPAILCHCFRGVSTAGLVAIPGLRERRARAIRHPRESRTNVPRHVSVSAQRGGIQHVVLVANQDSGGRTNLMF